MGQLNVFMAVLFFLAVVAVAISVAALFIASRNSDQLEDSADRANEASELANRAHEAVTGISLDAADVYGSHAQPKT